MGLARPATTWASGRDIRFLLGAEARFDRGNQVDSYGSYLAGQIEGQDYRFPLPEATREIKVQGSLNGKRLNYQILNNNSQGNVLYTYDRHNGLTRTDIGRENGILMLNEAPEVVTIFLTDADNRILSEYTLSGKQTRNKGMQLPETIKVNEAIRYELPQLPEGSRVLTRIVSETDLLCTSAEGALKYLPDFTSPMTFTRHLYAADEAEFNNARYASSIAGYSLNNISALRF